VPKFVVFVSWDHRGSYIIDAKNEEAAREAAMDEPDFPKDSECQNFDVDRVEAFPETKALYELSGIQKGKSTRRR